MFLNNVFLLNFVVGLISSVYDDVMDAKMKNTYIQRQELNYEFARTKSFGKEILFWNDDVEMSIDLFILINAED